ncbi:MAG TPA: imidazolonepropionase [Burkholderiales bacterium]|nr:imidazolonepropionase [Burkholderiales bacterium]
MVDAVWLNVHLATMCGNAAYGEIRDAALAVRDGRISWVGPRRAWAGRAREERDAGGAWITPGLIDCHTHLVYGGNRAQEFELRLQGASYEDIAKAGGGIVATVKATRAATPAALLKSAQKRLAQWLREGTAVIEIKSGYGLDRDTELKMLRVARQLAGAVTVKTTFLGAHAVPPEYKGREDDYIALVCDEVLPAAAAEGLADAVDAFCERIAFDPAQSARVLRKAKALGLAVKLHADQLSDLGGAALAAAHGALSADHMEHSSDAGIEAMQRAGTVAVLLPGAFYFLREKKLPPIEALRRHGVPIALATDHNPGSSPLTSPLLVLNMACTLFGLTPEEALAGMTRNGARALGMHSSHGTLEPGKAADFALWEIASPGELAYAVGANPCLALVRGGEIPRAAS